MSVAEIPAIQPGDTIKDNDPRFPERYLKVLSIGPKQATCNVVDTIRDVQILLGRIHTDDKPRKSGFSLVRGAAVSEPRS